MFLAITNG